MQLHVLQIHCPIWLFPLVYISFPVVLFWFALHAMVVISKVGRFIVYDLIV